MTDRALRRLLKDAPADVLQEYQQGGWQLTLTGGGHVRWVHPSGGVVFSASTPGDWRAWKNHLSHMRKAASRASQKP